MHFLVAMLQGQDDKQCNSSQVWLLSVGPATDEFDLSGHTPNSEILHLGCQVQFAHLYMQPVVAPYHCIVIMLPVSSV